MLSWDEVQWFLFQAGGPVPPSVGLLAPGIDVHIASIPAGGAKNSETVTCYNRHTARVLVAREKKETNLCVLFALFSSLPFLSIARCAALSLSRVSPPLPFSSEHLHPPPSRRTLCLDSSSPPFQQNLPSLPLLHLAFSNFSFSPSFTTLRLRQVKFNSTSIFPRLRKRSHVPLRSFLGAILSCQPHADC